MSHPRRRSIGLALAAAAALAVAACSDRPSTAGSRGLTAPDSASSSLLGLNLGLPILMNALTRTQPLPQDYTASVTLYRTSGTLDIPQAGLHVDIPATALPTDKAITITVKALKGSKVAYEFSPSGTTFKSALKVTQNLSGTTATSTSTLQVGYFKSLLDLAVGLVTGLVYELLPATRAPAGNQLKWDIWHFSGYMVTTGRNDEE